MLFEETERTLLCSHLFHQAGILAEYVPYTPLTAQNLRKLEELKPKTLAIMHGSSFTGDCARALGDLDVILREVFGRQA